MARWAPGANPVLFLISLAAGSAAGEALDLDGALNRLGRSAQSRLGGGESFASGFVSATMLFCVGTMGIMGSLQSGLNGDNRILFVKAALDGISAVVLASAYGGGVLLSAVPVLVYQGAIALAASALAAHVPESLKTELNIPGGIIIAALGLNMLGITRLKPVNMLPALLVPPAHLAVSSIFSF